jgi:hypothetical protein
MSAILHAKTYPMVASGPSFTRGPDANKNSDSECAISHYKFAKFGVGPLSNVQYVYRSLPPFY